MKNQIYKSNIKNSKQEDFKRRLYSLILRIIKFVEIFKKTSTSRIVGDQSLRSGTVWVSILRDTGNSNREEANWLLEELKEISSIFASSILTLDRKSVV